MAASTYKPPRTPTGRVSEHEFGTYLDEWFADTPTELVYPLSLATYSAMRRDGSVAAVQQGYTLQLRRAQWQLDGRGCNPDVTQMVADDMGLPILGEDRPGAARTRGVSWSEHLRVALNQALTFGHSGFALGADVSSGEARLNVLAERPPWTINEIHVDPVTGAFLGVTQDGYSAPKSPQILARDMAWYCLDREGANWAGRSMYYSAWLPWLIKREMIRIHASSNRRWGAGVPVMEALPGTAPSEGEMQAAAAMASAARAGEQAGAASPPGFQLKILGLSGAVPNTLEFIEWLDRQITRASLMSHLELGQGSSGGAYSLGAAFIDSWVLALETLGESIADTATRQIAARVVEWNRGEDEPVPRVTVSGVGSRREVTAEALQLLLTSGALTAEPALEAWVRKEYRLPEAAPAPVAAPGVTLPGRPGAVQSDGTAIPATAPSTDDGLIAAALAAANARNWGALNEVAAQMQAREAAAPPLETELPPQWAAVADDSGQDWKVDAALARGADVASAFASVYPDGDEQATQRGFDIWAADRQIAGDTTPATLDQFKQLVGAAQPPALTLDMDNRVVALAVRLGHFSALFAQPVTACPYKGADAEQTALRRVWLSAYLRVRPADAAAPAAPAADKTTPAATPTTPAAPAAPADTTVKAATRVLAAAGHPNACARADLGSVCHCSCGGVRHAWPSFNPPSGAKVPQSGIPGADGTKVPQDALPGVSGEKVPQVNPALEGLSGERQPAPATPPAPAAPTEPAPAESAPSAPEPPAPAESAPRTFDERVAAALTGDDARAAAPASLARDDGIDLTDAELDGLVEYRSDNYLPINHLLRGADPDNPPAVWADEPLVREWIAGIDSAMDRSPLSEDAVTWRGLDGTRLFGEALNGDMTDLTWREDAYVSTTTDEATANGFSGWDDGSVIMRILTPAGTGAVELSDAAFTIDNPGESELLLERGLAFRVVNDRGVDDNGVRQLDVEVVPNARRDEEAEGAADGTRGAGGGRDGSDGQDGNVEDRAGEGPAGGGLQPADSAPAEGRPDSGVEGSPLGDLIDNDNDLPTVLSRTPEQQAAAARVREQFAAAMNGTYGGLSTEVTSVARHFGGPDGEDFGAQADIEIRDANGNVVGHAERAIYRDADGNLVANHMLLELEPEVQGRGFAAEFNRHLEDWYRDQGVDRIELTANIDVGGYAWASHGYDFASDDDAQRVLDRMRSTMDSISDLDPAERAAAEALLERADRTPFGSDGFPSAFEISQVGRTPGATDWLGRDVMLGSNWEGVRWL